MNNKLERSQTFTYWITYGRIIRVVSPIFAFPIPATMNAENLTVISLKGVRPTEIKGAMKCCPSFRFSPAEDDNDGWHQLVGRLSSCGIFSHTIDVNLKSHSLLFLHKSINWKLGLSTKTVSHFRSVFSLLGSSHAIVMIIVYLYEIKKKCPWKRRYQSIHSKVRCSVGILFLIAPD